MNRQSPGCSECQDEATRKKAVIRIGSVVASPREALGVCKSCNTLQLDGDPMHGDLPAFISRKLALPGCSSVKITINQAGQKRGFGAFAGTHE